MEGSCRVVRAYSSELGFGSDFQNRCTIPYNTQEGKIIELQWEGRMEVVDVTAIDEGIGILEAARGRYLIIRRWTLEKDD